MAREMQILLEMANMVFNRLGVDLSIFRLQITSDNQCALYLKNTIFFEEEAFAAIKPIITVVPTNVKHLTVVRKSVKGGYTAIMPIRVIWETVIQNIPAVNSFINIERSKVPSSSFIFISKLSERSYETNSQGLIFQRYGWACSCEKNETQFDNADIELQTLVWAMHATGCFYMNIKFDSEPAIFKRIEPPSPESVALHCKKLIQHHQATSGWRKTAHPAF